MDKQRVDIKLTKQTLAWAAFRAAELGISRREFITRVVERTRMEQEIKDIPNYLLNNPATPDESYK